MCTVLLPPGDNPIAVNKYFISFMSGGGLKSFWLPSAEHFLRRWWLYTIVMSVLLLYSVEPLLFDVWAWSIRCTISHPYYVWYILISYCLKRGFLTKTLCAAYPVSPAYLFDDPPMWRLHIMKPLTMQVISVLMYFHLLRYKCSPQHLVRTSSNRQVLWDLMFRQWR